MSAPVKTHRKPFPVPETPEKRALLISHEFDNLANQIEKFNQTIAPCVRQLRKDFAALKPDETIMECRTWTQFCAKVLKRTDRAVRYLMTGGNPVSKRKEGPSITIRLSHDLADGASASLRRFAKATKVPVKNAACHLIEVALRLKEIKKMLEAA